MYTNIHTYIQSLCIYTHERTLAYTWIHLYIYWWHCATQKANRIRRLKANLLVFCDILISVWFLSLIIPIIRFLFRPIVLTFFRITVLPYSKKSIWFYRDKWNDNRAHCDKPTSCFYASHTDGAAFVLSKLKDKRWGRLGERGKGRGRGREQDGGQGWDSSKIRLLNGKK